MTVASTWQSAIPASREVKWVQAPDPGIACEIAPH
jgi:hypothetical protein